MRTRPASLRSPARTARPNTGLMPSSRLPLRAPAGRRYSRGLSRVKADASGAAADDPQGPHSLTQPVLRLIRILCRKGVNDHLGDRRVLVGELDDDSPVGVGEEDLDQSV